MAASICRMRAVRDLFRFLCAAILLMFLQGASAQELASLDLSDQIVPEQSALDKLFKYNKEHCPGGGMTIEGAGNPGKSGPTTP